MAKFLVLSLFTVALGLALTTNARAGLSTPPTECGGDAGKPSVACGGDAGKPSITCGSDGGSSSR
jgi:hypothetical protein